MELEKIAKETNAFICLDCGICTGSCPVSRVKPLFVSGHGVSKPLDVSACPHAETDCEKGFRCEDTPKHRFY